VPYITDRPPAEPRGQWGSWARSSDGAGSGLPAHVQDTVSRTFCSKKKTYVRRRLALMWPLHFLLMVASLHLNLRTYATGDSQISARLFESKPHGMRLQWRTAVPGRLILRICFDSCLLCQDQNLKRYSSSVSGHWCGLNNIKSHRVCMQINADRHAMAYVLTKGPSARQPNRSIMSNAGRFCTLEGRLVQLLPYFVSSDVVVRITLTILVRVA
jgi:hypothetical protein